MRDPNGPVPGFENEYYGSVGHEKKFHQDHFAGVALIGSQEWYIWSDGTRHRFKEKPNVRNARAARKRGGTHAKQNEKEANASS